MTKRIILTTMSTLYGANKNFYVVDGKYCDGISQLEVGTKYYLAKINNINEILVIGSTATIKEGSETKREKHPAILSRKYRDRNIIKEYVENKDFKDKPSAYAVYSYNIKQFITNKNNDDKDEVSPLEYGENKIDDFQKKHIKEIIYSCKKKINKDPIDFAKDDYNKLSGDVIIEIKNRIKEEYLTEEEKNKYRSSFVGILDHAEEDVASSIEIIKNNTSFNLFGKEICFRLIIEKIKDNLGTFFTDVDAVKKYQEDLKKLTKELDDIQNKRLQNEQQYAKEQIYNDMPAEHKLMCNKSNQKVKIRFVPLKDKNGTDNFSGILNALTMKDSNEDIEIYMDVQGGDRTDGYIRTAVLSFLNNLNTYGQNQKVHLKQVISVDFNRTRFLNPIADNTTRYRITDLVSGMNAFINYGKANQLVQTWNEIEPLRKNGKDSIIGSIFKDMQKIDQALSLCDVNLLLEAMKNLDKNLHKHIHVKNSNEAFIEVFKNTIQEDYKGIINIIDNKTEVDIFALVKWAYKKGFYQQTITLIESKMPEQMVKDGYFSYANENIFKGVTREEDLKYKVCEEIHSNPSLRSPVYKLNDINHLLVQAAANKYREKEDNKETDNNNKVIPFQKYETYDNNEEILECFAKIWDIRNKTNHAGEALTFDENKTQIKNFVDCYEAFLRKKNKNRNPLKCVSITEDDYNMFKELLIKNKWTILLNIPKPKDTEKEKKQNLANEIDKKLKEQLSTDKIIERVYNAEKLKIEDIEKKEGNLIIPNQIYIKYKNEFKEFENKGRKIKEYEIKKKGTVRKNKYEINLINSSSEKKKN